MFDFNKLSIRNDNPSGREEESKGLELQYKVADGFNINIPAE